MMNKTEKFVRQYLRSSCDPTSPLQPDLKLICSNGPSYAHKFALLSVLPDLDQLMCTPCLQSHDTITLFLPDFTTETVNEARDFLYMYGDVGSLAKIFGMMKVKEKIQVNLETATLSKNEGQKPLLINPGQTILEKRSVNKIRENTTQNGQPAIVSGDDISDHLRKAMSEYAERQKISVAAYPGIDFQKVEKKSDTGTSNQAKRATNGRPKVVSKSSDLGVKVGKRKQLKQGNVRKKKIPIKAAVHGEKRASQDIFDKLVLSGNEEVEIEEYIGVVTDDSDKNKEKISQEFFKQVDSLLLETKTHENTEIQVTEAPLIIKEMDLNNLKGEYNNKNDVPVEVPNNKTKKPYACENCEFSTKYRTVLKEHQRREKERTQTQSFKCNSPKCRFVTKNKGYLFRHIAQVHDSMQGGKLICSGCDFLTTDPESLGNHIREKHSGLKFKCEKCDYSNESKYWVDNHFATIHEGVRYPCDNCEYLSTSRAELTKHNKKFHA